MKRLTCFFILAFFLLTSAATARDRPQDYSGRDSFLAEYFTGLPKATQIERALDVVRALHPAWEANYQDNVWDCSEMSEYLMYFLGKCGIDTTYCQSNGLWHCWLEVQDGPDKIIIESTWLKIAPKELHSWYYSLDVNYDPYMKSDQIDWWNSPLFKTTEGR